MKNITLSASEELIAQAREVARTRKISLNQLFRDWLEELAGQKQREERLRDLDVRLQYARAGRKFTREELNAR
jgi:hypothetical protein